MYKLTNDDKASLSAWAIEVAIYGGVMIGQRAPLDEIANAVLLHIDMLSKEVKEELEDDFSLVMDSLRHRLLREALDWYDMLDAEEADFPKWEREMILRGEVTEK